MHDSRNPYLAFSLFLTLSLLACQVIQFVGHTISLNLVVVSAYIAIPISLFITYGALFRPSHYHITVAALLTCLLLLIGLHSRLSLDLSFDGMGYQQPGVQALLNGWNPLYDHVHMIWQNVYPAGGWAIEAALATVFQSLDAAKMLQFIWMTIAVPVFMTGISLHLGTIKLHHILLIVCSVFSPIIISQSLTHYIDAPLALAGISFLGAMMMLGSDARTNIITKLFMSAALVFIINAKLSGLYHAFMLCFIACAFLWIRDKKLPIKPAVFLVTICLFATFILGWSPYVTNLMANHSFLPFKSESFSSAQRPVNLEDMNSVERFTYSVFSKTRDDSPRSEAELKFPWQIDDRELIHSGYPDTRTGGYGPLFALGLLATLLYVTFMIIKYRRTDLPLCAIAGILLIFSMLFPESWWARYVPFAYLTPFFLLLALPLKNTRTLYVILTIFSLNSVIALYASQHFYSVSQKRFHEIVEILSNQHITSVILIPPGDDYERYNHGYESLSRWLGNNGISSKVVIDGICNHKVDEMAEFTICY